MIKKRKKVVVTLADQAYLTQAKQLFSSLYFNGGWDGDFLLLAVGCSDVDLDWFRKRKILVRKCPLLFKGRIGKFKHKSIVLNKLFLIDSYMKQWNNVVYLDADIMVRASIDRLAKVKGFAACGPLNHTRMKDQFTLLKEGSSKGSQKNRLLMKEKYYTLQKRFKLYHPSFNTGVMAFSTDIISPSLFSNMKNDFKISHPLYAFGDESLFNAFFYGKWKPLPDVYHVWPEYISSFCQIDKSSIEGVVLHFMFFQKPWEKQSYFFREWSTNLQNADCIGSSKTTPKIWSQAKIMYISKKIIVCYQMAKIRDFVHSKWDSLNRKVRMHKKLLPSQ